MPDDDSMELLDDSRARVEDYLMLLDSLIDWTQAKTVCSTKQFP